VNFVGNSELIVDNVASFGTNVGSASYAGTQLQNFAGGDKIDLKTFSSAGATLSYNSSTGVLQVSNGSQTADLAFQTSTLGGTSFQATSDGASGTFITTSGTVSPPTITAPANGSTITTSADPTISGSGINGDTVSVSIDGTVAGTTTVASGTWSYTPTTPLSNASHSVSATQAAAGGPSSAPSSVDTFTINVPTPPAGSTISSSTAGPIILSASSTPLYVTSTGAVTSTGSGANGINGATGTSWTISNAGKVTSSGGDGVSLASASLINNTGTLSAVEAVVLRAGGTVTNASNASISSSGNTAGIYIAGAIGTVTNAGTISAVYHGIFMAAGGSVSNAISGSISGQHNGIIFRNQAGTVTNSGNVSGTGPGGTGVYLQSNGAVTNTSTGTISGHQFGAFIEGGFGNVANYGSMSGASYDGIVLGLGGMVTNAAGASITGGNNGVYVKYRAAGTVTNSGHITGSAAGSTGIDFADGGILTNNSSGTISGKSYGVFLSGAAGTVVNAGTISGGGYAINFTGSATNRLIVDPGAVFAGTVTANSSGTNTMELASGSAAGSTGGVGTAFKGFRTLAVDSGAVWTLAGANAVQTLLDNGTLNIAGSLTASSAVDPASTGLFQIQSGASLEVAADTGTKTQISFLGSSKLIADNVSSFGTNVGTASYAGPLLENFVNGDTIDLKHFSSSAVTLSYNPTTGLLQLSNGSSQHASLAFQASTLGSSSFQTASDGAGGTLITTAADNDTSPEPPVLTISNTSLSVTAGGFVGLGISAIPSDSDDAVSVTISGVPTYETISAPSGDTVTHQSSSTTWTITSAAGVSITGIALTSSYTGSGHPVAALTVAASNTTSGESASSASQTLNVTDPPSATSSALPNSTPHPRITHLAALLDQFVAAGFATEGSGAGQIASFSSVHGQQELALLAHPHH
ncbi:MAG: hypothetical protein JOY67_11725, partial [Hyphomicrobiales bacterium]|nr:hypothetical protein [Hyphomicrobiales bacterium]